MTQMTKILLVEDDKDVREALSTLLEHAGYCVIPAQNGKEALEQLNRGPSLIILDIMLPDISGYEISTKIRSDCR